MHEKPQMNALQVAERVAARYARRVFWADPEDLKQEATVAALAAQRTFDPRIGVPFAGYAWRACVLHLRAYVWANSAPVSETDHHLTDLRGVYRDSLDAAGDVVDGAAPPDEQLDVARRQHAVRGQVSLVLAHALRNGDVVDRLADAYIAERVLVDEVQPARLAAELEMPVQKVYRIAQRARTVLAENAVLYGMWEDA